MPDSVYIETSVISYLTSRPSRDLVLAAHQQLTAEWWSDHRGRFSLHCSQVVIDEASRGDQSAASLRVAALEGIPILRMNEQVLALSRRLLSEGAVPQAAAVDALHIAISATHAMDYLLTWNCAHIANAQMRHRIEGVCLDHGVCPPVICTPEELLGA